MHSTGQPLRNDIPAQITFAVVATALAAVVPLVLVGFWTMTRIDRQASARERLVVEHAIEAAIAQVPFDQRAISIRDDSVFFTHHADEEWMAENFGEWMHTYHGHDHAVVLSERDQPIHVMLGGATRTPEDFGEIASVVLPQVAELRRQLAEGTGRACRHHRSRPAAVHPRLRLHLCRCKCRFGHRP